MNFGIDIRHLTQPNPSGIGRYTLNLIDQLAVESSNDTFTLFATGTKKTLTLLPPFSHQNIRVVTKQIPNKLFKALMLVPGGPTMEAFLPHAIDAWLFPDSNIIRTELPYAMTAHDLSYEFFPQFFTVNQKIRHAIARTDRLLKQAKAILAVSEATKNDLIESKQLTADRIFVTPLGVGTAFHKKSEPQDANFRRTYQIQTSYFLTLSTLEPRKNIESVIEAYDRWRETITAAKAPQLIIAGALGWKTRGITRALARAKHKKDIRLIGYVDEAHKPALYRAATAVFFPSFYEGFGLPALEAMACGTPVVCSFSGSLPEVVQNAAVLIDPFNVRDIEQAMDLVGLESSSSLRAELTRLGVDQAQQFTWEKTAKKTLKILHKLAP